MPIYEYQCDACSKRTEILQRMSDPPLASCPDCGGAVRKMVSAPAFQFKGSGWYVTDYAGKKAAPAGSAKSESGSGADSGSDGKGESSSSAESTSASKAEAKSESKSDAKSESKAQTKVDTKS